MKKKATMFVGNALNFIPCELESAYKNFLVEPKYLRIFVAGDSFIGKHGWRPKGHWQC